MTNKRKLWINNDQNILKTNKTNALYQINDQRRSFTIRSRAHNKI